MKSNTSILLIILLCVIAFAAYVKISNPYKRFSTKEFWISATIDDVYTIPEEALRTGNINGSVLMWATTATNDPKIITAIIGRGADVNEADIIFSGTPLSWAAAYASNPAIIDELIKHGAKINKVVGSNNKTPLIIAAELNSNPPIIDRLIYHGADVGYKDLTGKNALDQAERVKNTLIIPTLRKY